jgi:RNA recognition motif-containing protein
MIKAVGLPNELATSIPAGWHLSVLDRLPTDRVVTPAPFSLDPESDERVGKPRTRNFRVGKKLYVGNLTFGVSNADLEALFAPFGSVQSAQVIQDRETGRSKGFGFVEMGSDSEASAAIAALHEREHDGRRLTVNEAKPREDRGGGGGRGGGGYGGGRGGGGYGGGGGRY